MTNFILSPENSYLLPFEQGTWKLTLANLDRHTAHRRPRINYWYVDYRIISYENEILTVSVIVEPDGEEEKVYFKVSPKHLKVSCSVDTTSDYLSYHAYCCLERMMSYHKCIDFEVYYWPDFFNQDIGRSKYLKICHSKGNLHISTKVRYKGFYRPGKQLPEVAANFTPLREPICVTQEQVPKENHIVLGFCLADLNNERYRTNHYPFLIPYIAILNKGKTEVKNFITYVFNDTQLADIDLSDEQQHLVEICFAMKKIALVANWEYGDDDQMFAEKRQQNENNFNQLFELWQEALPLLSSRLYTHYKYTFGMRHVKGKPRKSDMALCSFSIETPEICFLWKDLGDYYKLELRLLFEGKIQKVPYYFNSTFFVMLTYKPKKYALLNAVKDCELLSYFQQSQYQVLVLKKHFEGDFKGFVEQLRAAYKFVSK